MSKWADYVITCVNYDGNKISNVRGYADKPDDRSDRKSWRRDQVVKELDDGKTFVTAFMNEGQWKKGAQILRRKINGEWFI
jgi:hypothetical protein